MTKMNFTGSIIFPELCICIFIFIFLFLRQIEAVATVLYVLCDHAPKYFRKIMKMTAIFRKYNTRKDFPALERRTN